MAFPDGILDIDVALDLDGDGVYETDISEYVLVEDDSGRIEISRGAGAEGSQTESSRCELILDNRDGRFSPRNVNGAYYGQLGRNTAVQVAVHAGDRYLAAPSTAGARASTPDAAVLDITGDLDVRVDLTFDTWTTASVELIGKRAGAGQISWHLLRNTTPSLTLSWSTDGTALTSYVSSATIPLRPDRRTALRATLDVNNGLGGYTVTFYTAPTIDGPWVQLDQTVTTGGTTSIFNSTAPLEIGDLSDAVGSIQPARFHAAEVYSGIDGTLVANPDFRIQDVGDTSFADTTASPRTWTVAGAASISDKKIRFTGQVSEWPVEWDTTGVYIHTDIAAAGPLRRLDSGAKPLQSTLRRRIPTLTTDLIAYWPLEEPDGATRFSSPMTGVRHLQISGWETGSVEGPRGSSNVAAITEGAYISGQVPAPSSAATEWHCEFVFNMPEAPASNVTLLRFAGTGTVKYWELMLRTGFFHVNGIDSDGTSVVGADHAITDTDVFGKWCRMQLFAEQNGGNVDYTIRIIRINVGDSLDTGTLSYAGTVGRISAVTGGQPVYGSGADGTAIGHISVWKAADTTAYNDADHGYNGETAINRIARLASEGEFDAEFIDWDTANLSEAMGSQAVDDALSIIREVERTDHGVLTETREELKVKYIDRGALLNQPVLTVLDYETDLMPGIVPIDDDRFLLNHIDVGNRYGAGGFAELTTGRLSTQDPPDGVGLYATTESINCSDDARSDDHANWFVHEGTVDEARFPVINLNLARNPEISEEVIRLDVGHRFQIENIPAKLMYNDLDLIIVGYEERIHQFTWEVTLFCRPASPYTVGVVDDDDLGRVDTDGSEVVVALSTTDTTVDVYASEGNTWTKDSGDYPLDASLDGERVTVTAATNRAADDFSDAQTDTWASADIGGSWTNTGGAASDYDKVSGLGTHTHTSANVLRGSTLALALADLDMIADIQTAALATGNSLYAGLMARHSDLNNFYWARLTFATTGVITLQMMKRVAGVQSQVGSTYTSTHAHAVDTSYRVRFQADGTALRARMWLASKPEPGFWHVDTTDSSLTAAGNTGLVSIRDAANTNANAVIRFDNFAVENPTRWTVTRSVNGVVKAQSAGTDVKLWTPTIISL